MQTNTRFALLIGAGLSIWQLKLIMNMKAEREAKWAAAVKTSKITGKPMLVVGGPKAAIPIYSFFFGLPHGCGDV